MGAVARPVVRVLDADAFDSVCAELAAAVVSFDPDLLVGIATGGVHVARAAATHLAGSPPVVVVAFQRPSTKVKHRLGARRVLPRLPEVAKQWLRRWEVSAREALLGRRRPGPPPDAAELPAPDEALLRSARRVVIVDDTIDSGRTLRAAVDAVRKLNPEAAVRTAVLASTFKRPPVVADHCLYDRTLFTFPWSMDAR